MKKFVLLLSLAVVFLCSCGKASEETGWVMDEAPYVTIVSGEESMVPYFHFGYSWEWTDKGWLSADGEYWLYTLSDTESEFPVVTWGGGIELVFNRDSSFRYIHILDEDCAELYYGDDLSVLDELEPGRYYVSIAVTVQGQYIPEGDDFEHSGWLAVFVLEKL